MAQQPRHGFQGDARILAGGLVDRECSLDFRSTVEADPVRGIRHALVVDVGEVRRIRRSREFRKDKGPVLIDAGREGGKRIWAASPDKRND